MKALVAYFSAESGRTASVAKTLASAIDADLFEIRPEKPYTSSDLNYMNPLARCNREHITKKAVPVEGMVDDFEQYDTVLINLVWLRPECGQFLLQGLRFHREEGCRICHLRRKRDRQNGRKAEALCKWCRCR